MFERRLQVLLVVLGVVCCAIVVRAFSLQAVGRNYWARQAENALSDETELATTRGRILDYKGRELAVDQPCIDACVHYEAIAFNRPATALRDTALERLAKKDADFEKLSPADRRQRLESEVSKVIGEGSPVTLKWLRTQARNRVRRANENYDQLPLAERWRLLNAAVCATIVDIESMWHDLAKLTNQSDEKIDDIRRQIVRRVETRRRLVWYAKYDSAAKSRDEPSWLDTLLGGGGKVDLDKFDVHVSEERDVHVILPNIDYALRNEIARRAAAYPGLVLREGVRRVYPYGSLASQTIGRIAKVSPQDIVDDPRAEDRLGKYAATDDIGREGLEKLFESDLRGTRGLAQSDADGGAATLDPVPGRDVQTTLDADLQSSIEAAFKKVTFVRAAQLDADELDMPGAAVLIDVPTGEVRAMVSWPTYDLNTFDKEFPDLVKNQIRRPLANRATGMAVEPGSTVKPIIGIGAITAGVFGAHDTIPCTGYVIINGRRYTQFGRCWTMRMFHGTHMQTPSAAPHPNNNLNFPEALQRSCNVFHEELAYKLGIGGVSFWFDKFGLGKPTGVGLPEARGILPDRFDGPAVERMVVNCLAGIGESHVAATPIQMANVAATIARSGVAIRPTLRSGDRPTPVDLQLNPASVAEAREGMYAVVNTVAGTGRAAYLPDIVVAAKTGSAQTGPLRIPLRDRENKPVKDERGRVIYEDIALGTHANPNPRAPWYRAIGRDEDVAPAHGWMIGYAPADKPKVAFAVLVEFGGGGGPAAGSVVKKMLEACVEQGYLTR